MIELTLYKNLSEKNKVGKSLEVISNIQGDIKEETSIINPIILVNTNLVPQSNYAYIPAFGRYYFINDIKCIRTNLWEISMHCDVLDSFQNEIKKNNALIARQEFDFNWYLKDNLLEVYEDSFILTKKLTNSDTFESKGYVLLTQ